jgi:hypothetical protein
MATYSYPKRSINNTDLYLKFTAYEYSKASQVGSVRDIRDQTTNASAVEGFLSNFDNKTELNAAEDNTSTGSVQLYLPPKLSYSYGAEWQKVSFGGLAAAYGNEGGLNLGNLIGATGVTIANFAMDKLVNTAAFNNIPKVQNVNLDTIIGATLGQTFNDNTLQTFNRMNTRSFSFEYIMVARNSDEEEEIKQIINFFKIGMHPNAKRKGAATSLFLEFPLIWRITPSLARTNVRRKENGVTTSLNPEGDVGKFLPETKYCAMTNFEVDYTPDSVIALTKNKFVQAVRISLQFAELTTLVRQDFSDLGTFNP